MTTEEYLQRELQLVLERQLFCYQQFLDDPPNKRGASLGVSDWVHEEIERFGSYYDIDSVL